MPDVYLFPSEPNASDVRLREGVPSITHTVEVAVTATATPAVTTLFVPGVPPPTVGGGGRPAPPFIRPAPVLVHRQVEVEAVAHAWASVELAVDHVGRRQQEDELVLLGAI